MLKRIWELFGGKSENEPDGDRADDSPRPAVHHGPRVVSRPIPRHDLDPDAVKIVQRLTRFDHHAYLVGGCVRDLLLEREPKDFDVGTSATPRQIKRLFRNSRIIGRRFRLAHIYFQNGKLIEVATFRALDGFEAGDDESKANDKDQDLMIRDDNVFGTMEEDALRRDFTINSLFYDVNNETVLDHADGLGDLKRKLIRTIGEPEIRFREDPIRSLRAIKFAARLDFEIEPKTLQALRDTRNEIPKAAPPRILEEINRFCRGGAARRSFELMRETQTFEVVFPEIAGAYAGDPEGWQLMLEMLERFDRPRPRQEGEVRTGEILIALLLPRIRESFGWKDGKVDRERGLKVREIVDDQLRPMSLRLRVPRREQEHCRMVLSTLYRMVPSRRVRRSVQHSILQRESLGDALVALDLLAKKWGGEFREALEFWKTGAEQVAPKAERRERGREGDEPQGTGRRRRRPRRKKPAGERADGERPPTTERKEKEKGRAPAQARAKARPAAPGKRDDDSFFAALPSVPEMGGEEGTDRYGAASVAPPVAEDAPEETPESGSVQSGDPPRRSGRRRRRRPRRKPREAGDGSRNDETSEPSPDEGRAAVAEEDE